MKNKEDGFISLIIILILALAAAKYFFDWSLFEAANTPEGQGTLAYIKQILALIWHYLQYPLTWTWNHVIWPILELAWHSATNR